MQSYADTCSGLSAQPRVWLVTGAAGFIGSNLVEALLLLGQKVVGMDNFLTGHQKNLDQVRRLVPPDGWARFQFLHADIRDPQACREACAGVDYVLHQAALGSVPRSIEDPQLTHEINATGFLNMLTSAREAGVSRFVYASSSSVYGDHPGSPKVEHAIGKPLSPYAAGKRSNEDYARAFARCYGMQCAGLRYFNVFGRRQDAEGPYSAVIPRWVSSMIRGEPVYINGDGETTRDFCHIANVIQANILAATVKRSGSMDEVYNVAVGDTTSLNELFEALRSGLALRYPHVALLQPTYREMRAGDVRHSLADISWATQDLGYMPTHPFAKGLREALDWYANELGGARHPQSAGTP
jgi:UDP-N-acetylglucosamine/UDP-N-acetylgalactosamine 4-epimerase